MTRDFGREELKRLLRRIDEVDGPSSYPAPDLDRLDLSERASPSDPGGLPNAFVADPGAALQPVGKGAVAEISSKSRKPRVRTMAVLVAVAAAVGAILALRIPAISTIVTRGGVSYPDPRLPATQDPRAIDLNRQSQRSVTPSKPAVPLLAMMLQKTSLQRGQDWPLAVRTTMRGNGITLTVTGLAAGTKLSAGQPLEANSWGLDANNVDNVVLTPPDGFVGTMDLSIELLQNGAITDRQSVQVEWLGQETAAVPQAASASLKPGDVTRLLERGEELLASGEIVAARAVFKRLAESGEARAALALAETYERSTLEKLGARGLAADVAMARSWYEKAKQLGSPEAQRRLDALVTQSK